MIKIAIIGTGGMANAHAQGFGGIDDCKLVACCDVVPGKAREFADKYNIPSVYEDARQMLENEEIDGVSIVTPDVYHKSPALLAIEFGKNVMCEKPLASTLEDAREMAAAAKAKGVLTAVNFSYRDNPATQKAAEMVASGAIGRPIHIEGSYLQSWLVSHAWGDWRTGTQWLWRLSTKHGSAGVLGDVGVHLYDLASFVVGDIAEIECRLKTFKKEFDTVGEYVLDANDSAAMTVTFANGALGALHTTRWATGHMNTVALRVYGDKGALDLNLDRQQPDTLRACLGEDIETATWKQVECPQTPSMYQRFAASIRDGVQAQTSFEQAAKVQAYLAYSAISSEKGCAVGVEM